MSKWLCNAEITPKKTTTFRLIIRENVTRANFLARYIGMQLVRCAAVRVSRVRAIGGGGVRFSGERADLFLLASKTIALTYRSERINNTRVLLSWSCSRIYLPRRCEVHQQPKSEAEK